MSAIQCRAVFSSKVACPSKRRPLVVPRAEPTDRRAALFGLASVAALVAGKPAEAAYGEAANIFGKPTTTSGFIPYDGEGFALLLPSKYNPDKEKPFPGTVLRYVDFYPVNSLTVLKVPASKASVDGYGTPEAFLTELQNMGIFGKQAYTGSSRSEGGFAEGRYAAASLLDTSVVTDKKGKKYYQYEVLVRSADGNEGGRNETIKAAVGKDNQLYILINQIGDKRTVVGKKNVIGSTDSFSVA